LIYFVKIFENQEKFAFLSDNEHKQPYPQFEFWSNNP